MNNRVEKHVNPNLIKMKGEIDRSTIVGRDFNTPVSRADKTVSYFNRK